uniref:16S rRNA (cytosine(1402)-N(4))-methyltransferase n=1 Tax=Staphylococcus epidermidis TaxID=1282 RepID=UPI00119CAB22
KPAHPAKRLFQPIRIPVNHDLSPFQDSLHQPIQSLNLPPTISLITFHSFQHPFSKQIFQHFHKPPHLPTPLPLIPQPYTPNLKPLNPKPITPTDHHLNHNNPPRTANLP